MKINKNSSKKKIALIIVPLVILLGVGMYLGVAAVNKLPPFSTVDTTYEPGEQVVNLERSEAEKAREKELIDNPELKTQNEQTDTPSAPTTTDSGKAAVNVLVTNASISNGTVSASGFVTNLVEEGGSCTYVFTSGSSTVTKNSQTLTNPSSTTCATVTFPSSELLVSGTWKVTLSYSSEKAAGKSDPKEFTK